MSVEQQERARPSFFAPTAAEAAAFHLDRCMRILPHVQDSGGFFVALLRKTAPLFHGTAAASTSTTTTTTAAPPSAAAVGAAPPSASAVGADEADMDADVAPPPAQAQCEPPRRDNTAEQGTAGPGSAVRGGQASGATSTSGTGHGGGAEDEEGPAVAVGGKWEDRDPFLPLLTTNAQAHQYVRHFYGLLPEFSLHNLFVRSTAQRKIYFVGREVAGLLRAKHRNSRFKVSAGKFSKLFFFFCPQENSFVRGRFVV